MSAPAAEVVPAVSIIDSMADANLLGASFAGESREAWRAALSGAFALPMGSERHALFSRLAGGREPPQSPVREMWAIAGRRSDKTHTAAGIAVYLGSIGAELSGALSRLSPGERGVVQVVAVDRQQAGVALGYVRGILEDSPVLAPLVAKHSAEGVILTNGVSVEVATNSHRSVRGRTLLAAVLDECAFYRDESSATPDTELYRALIPSLATTGGMLIGISSPYAKRGLLYDKWKRHYGQNSADVLVLQGGTAEFNPNIDPQIIADAEADDPEAARAEWHGLFREDVESFLQREVVEAAVRPDPLELPHDRNCKYQAFADPAGGGADEFTLAIGHRDGEAVVVDALRARRGTPAEIVGEYVELLRLYGIGSLTLDRYAGSWPADEFERHGIKAQTAEQPKSGLYLDALASLNSGRVELPPDDRLVNQFVRLERRTARGGRESIDHPPGGHDDRANAAAGLVAQMSAGRRRIPIAEWL